MRITGKLLTEIKVTTKNTLHKFDKQNYTMIDSFKYGATVVKFEKWFSLYLVTDTHGRVVTYHRKQNALNSFLDSKSRLTSK